MSAARTGFYSADPVERLDAARKLIRKLAAEHDLDEAHVGRALGYAQQRWHKVMTLGQRSGPRLSDLVLLSEMLGDDDQLVETLAKTRGGRFVREHATAPTGGGEGLEAARAAVSETAQILGKVAALMGRAVTPADARALSEGLDRARRHLGRVEAEIGMAVVEPPVVTPIRRTK